MVNICFTNTMSVLANCQATCAQSDTDSVVFFAVVILII